MTTIEIWSDVACPFCYIGKKHLQAALERDPQRTDVTVIWRSFELDPNAPRGNAANLHETLAAKYGRSVEWARQMNENLKQQGKQIGIDFDFNKVIPTNSFDAHRMIQLAKVSGCAEEMQELLFKAFFCEGKDIADPATLVATAEAAGLNREEARQTLASDRFAKDVREEEAVAQSFGLSGVPAFVIDRKLLISGAQPTEVFLQALQEARSQKE